MAEAVVVAKDEMKRYLPYLGMFRYIRNSFWNAGQDSYTQPPAQNEDLFELLTNVQPVMTGTLVRRWGYALWAPSSTLLFQPVRLILYQRDADGERAVVACEESTGGSTLFFPYKEDGTTLFPAGLPGISSPGVANPVTAVRAVSSRDWFYTNTWDGTYHYKWGGQVPPAAPTVANSGSGSVSGTYYYVAAYVDSSGVTHGISLPSALTSSSQTVMVTSPVAQVGMVSWTVGAGSSSAGPFYPQNTAALGSGIALGALGLSGPTLVAPETMLPMGAISPANAPIFSIGGPSGSNRTVSDGVMTLYGYELSSATANFLISDTGAEISVAGAGPAGAALVTTVLVVLSSTQVGLNSTASTAVSGATVSITDLPYRSSTDGAITINTNTLSSASLAFVSTDVGSTVYIAGAAPGGNLLKTTITSILSSTQVTLAAAASTTVSSAHVTVQASGTFDLSVGRIYFAVFRSTLTGHVSDLSPASLSTGPQNGTQIIVNVSTAVIGPATPGMDEVVLLATADGGDEQTLYKVASGPAATTTTLTDGLPEAILLDQQIYGNVDVYGNYYGAVGNDPPQVQMEAFLKHQGRLFAYSGQNIYFSKSIAECLTSTGTLVGHYEECWPANYFFDISQQAENVRAHFSDGTVYYIGTERRIYRLIGNTPLAGTTGTTFQEPEVVFSDVGVVNPDVWQAVYNAGQPIGTCWLTPDLRVILSDFNSYQDIGHQVQDVLNTINTSAIQASHAIFASSGSFDLYILCIPTGSNTLCDTQLVYNMRTGKWVVWQPTNLVSAMLFDITESGETLVLASVNGTGTYYVVQYGAQFPNDNVTVEPAPPPYHPVPGSFPVSIQTSWLSLQDISLRKVLNQLEIISDNAGGLEITVWGANSQSDFDTPNVIVAGALPAESVLGSWFVYLAGYASVYRYFKILFVCNQLSQTLNILEGFNLEAVPFNRE